MTNTPVVVDMHPDAVEVIVTAATATRPRETGGLLLGWWDSGHVVIRHAVEVPDPGATTNSWSRDEPFAQAALDAALDKHHHPLLGYVGDWHTHPAPCGPSSQDVASIRRASQQYPEPLVLLVHRSNSSFDHVVAHRGRLRPATIATPLDGRNSCTMTTPLPAAGRASASGTRRGGDRFQDLFVWGAAMQVIRPDAAYAQVEVEINGVGNLDDVVLRGTGGNSDIFGQVKWATNPADLVNTEYLQKKDSSTSTSLLQKLFDSWRKVRGNGAPPTLQLITNRALDGTDLGRHAGRLPLGRLDDVQVAALAAERAGGPVDPEAVAYLCAVSGGLPLLVADLTSGLVYSGGLRREGGMWRPDGPLRARVPGAFTRLVAGRVRGLTEPVRTLVRTAALLGDDLDWRFVATATGDDDPAAGLRAAVDAGLFRTGDPDALHWRHALTRDAVLDELTPPERAELTHRVATHLQGASLTGAQLAVAADLCAQAGDRPRAAGLLLELGREHLAAGALVVAGDVLASAAALVDDGAGAAAEIAVERLRALGLRARTDDALALGDEVLPGLPVDGAARVRLQLVRACVAAERWEDAARHLDAAAPTISAERLALAAHVALGRFDVDSALRLAAEAIAAGHRDGAPEAVCEALEITGRVLRSSDAAASRAAFTEGARLAAEHGLVPWQVRALAELATHDVFGAGDLGRLREARRLDLQLIAAGASIDGHVATLPLARRCADTAARLRLPGPAAHALVFVARGQFWAGDTAAASATLEEYLRTGPNPIASASTRAAYPAWDAWLSHDGERAASLLSRTIEGLRASAVSRPAPLWGHWALLSTVVHPQDPAPLAELRGSDVLVDAANRAALQYGDAVVAARAGAVKRSRELVEAADASLAGRNYDRLLLRCLMIGPAGATAAFDAEVLLREALTRWEPAREVRLARWCRERLRMLGLPVPRPARDRVVVPPTLRALGVTGRELEVLRLVADGATNSDVATRLHLSPRTVETHVSSLLAKTGAIARAELAVWLPALAP